MKPFEIAVAVRNRPNDESETLEAFMLRKFSQEKMTDFQAALKLCIGWERALEEIEKLCDALRLVGAKTPDVKIDVLIEKKQRLGYDAVFEALLARRWRCPHCKQFTSISKIELPIGNPGRLPRCVTCGEEGVAPIDGEAKIKIHDGGRSGLRPI